MKSRIQICLLLILILSLTGVPAYYLSTSSSSKSYSSYSTTISTTYSSSSSSYSSSSSQSSSATVTVTDYVPNQIIVKLKESANGEPLDISNVAVVLGVSNTSNLVRRIHPISGLLRKYRGNVRASSNQLSDEQAFTEVYKGLSPLRKELYRKYLITLPDNISVPDAEKILDNLSDVERHSPNYLRRTTDDPYVSQQWSLSAIQSEQALAYYDGCNAPIAVIDTGVDYTHEDLSNRIWINYGEDINFDYRLDARDIDGIDNDNNGYIDDFRGYDFVSTNPTNLAIGEDAGPSDNDPIDFHGHGTHVAGIIAAQRFNGFGIYGVSKCKVMALRSGYKATNGTGLMSESDISEAILYAVDNGASVINMSFGSYSPLIWDEEISLAHSSNIILVAAVGNDYQYDTPFYPAAHPDVIAVGSHGWNSQVPTTYRIDFFSNFGFWLDILAPGSGILSTLPGNRYSMMSGSSMAAPHVAAAAAVIRDAHFSYTPEMVRQTLRSSAIDLNGGGYDEYAGYGRLGFKAAQILSSPLGVRLITKTWHEHNRNFFIQQPLDIYATVEGWALKEYKLEYRQDLSDKWYQLASGQNVAIQDTKLATIDPALFAGGRYILRLRAINTNDKEFVDQLIFRIIHPMAPVFEPLQEKIIKESEPFSIPVIAHSIINQPVTLRLISTQSGAVLNSSGEFMWTPTKDQLGRQIIRFSAENTTPEGKLVYSSYEYNIIVSINPLSAPSSPTIETIQNQVKFRWTDNSSDEDGFNMQIGSVSTGPFQSIFSTSANVSETLFSNLPPNETRFYRVCAFRGSLTACSPPVSYTFNPPPPPNHIPTIQPIDTLNIIEDSELNIPIVAADADGDPLTYTIANMPEGALFDQQNKTFNWKPKCGQSGNYNLTLTVSDSKDNISVPFKIIVSSLPLYTSHPELPQNFRCWAIQSIPDSAFRSVNDDPDFDDVKNIKEYAFGSSPVSGTQKNIPYAYFKSGKSYYRYYKNKKATDLKYTLSFSNDLVNYTEYPNYSADTIVGLSDDGVEIHEFVLSEAPARFVKLNVALNQ